MKKILLFLILAFSFSAYAQNDLKKVLFVENSSDAFGGILYDRSFVYDSTDNYLYLLPTGGLSTDNLDSISDKVVTAAGDADSLGGLVSTQYLHYSDTTSTLSTQSDVRQILYTKSVELDSSDIRNLNTTAVEVLAAPGSGNMYDIHSILLDYDYSDAAYTGDSTIVFLYNGLGNYAESVDAIDGTSDQQRRAILTSDAPVGANKAINVKAKTSDPVGGTATGTLTIYISYRIQEL